MIALVGAGNPLGFPPSPCRASAVPGLAGGVLEVPAVRRAGGLAVLGFAGAAPLLQQSATRVVPGHRVCQGHVPLARSSSWLPSSPPRRQPCSYRPASAQPASGGSSALTSCRCFSQCYWKGCPVNEAFGLVAAWLLNSTWRISARRWATSPSSPHSQPWV